MKTQLTTNNNRIQVKSYMSYYSHIKREVVSNDDKIYMNFIMFKLYIYIGIKLMLNVKS